MMGSEGLDEQRRIRLSSIRMRQQSICVMVPPRASLFELATPVGVWGAGRANHNGEVPFALTAASPSADRPVATTAGLVIGGMVGLGAAAPVDLVVIPTWPVGADLTPPEQADCRAIVAQARAAHERGSTVVGLCLGAFAVAEAGLVDGRQAVTHWAHRDRFSARFPAVTYARDSLYVDLGDVVTSAGSAAALDCCLYLVRQSHGAEVATRLARSLVTSPHRAGNQTQYVPPDTGPGSAGASGHLGRVLAEATGAIGAIITVSDLARRAGMSRRSLERAFAASLAVSPAEWLIDQRVERARLLLEKSEYSVEEVASRVGFGSAATLRRHFRKRLLTTPTAYRAQFGEEVRLSSR